MTSAYRVFVIKSRQHLFRVKVSPQDAHLLRNYVYQIDPGKDWKVFYPRRKVGTHGQYQYLCKDITGASPDQAVHYKNGDSLDLRRENLIVSEKKAAA